MKKLFFVLAFLLCFVAVASGAPFLVCDPYPLPASNQPDSFEVTITPLTPFIVPATTNTDNSVSLHYDLATAAGMGAGSHNASAIAIQAGWRSGVSNVAPFTKPALATPNISISNK